MKAEKENNVTTETLPKDSGAKREFDTGAHRDAAVGKGREDLLPLVEVALVMNNDPVVMEVAAFQNDNDIAHLAAAIRFGTETLSVFQYEAMRQDMEAAGVTMRQYESDEEKKKACLANMMLEVSKLYEAGAIKYGENNWQKGMPVSVYLDSGLRHYFKTLRGDTDEPHWRGFVWNLLCAMWTVDNISSRK